MTEQPGTGDDDARRRSQPSWNPPYGSTHGSGYGPSYRADGHVPPLPPSAPHLGQQPFGQAPGGYGYGQPAGPHAGPQVPGPYADAYGQPNYYGVPAAPKGLSIASLCCGIAAFMGFGFFLLPQLAAVVLGHLALTREPGGRGLAIAGLVLGYAALAITVLVIVVLGVAFANAEFISR
ncbi:DUF4190 domain-containing protein [Arthrobacter sp. Soil763]|uniref:DUF4190 domain-containing protein n=1 Tax=Arthrobacter sp. Soil763 TaxID=1736402 RepID=UPI0006FB5560|nr:DUF4190 domain-containing protein [Arthrobacter sp. Soil763]KRE81884.1 hypothetical protein ASG71_02160 [Arthrobacter sp. Soil763]